MLCKLTCQATPPGVSGRTGDNILCAVLALVKVCAPNSVWGCTREGSAAHLSDPFLEVHPPVAFCVLRRMEHEDQTHDVYVM